MWNFKSCLEEEFCFQPVVLLVRHRLLSKLHLSVRQMHGSRLVFQGFQCVLTALRSCNRSQLPGLATAPDNFKQVVEALAKGKSIADYDNNTASEDHDDIFTEGYTGRYLRWIHVG